MTRTASLSRFSRAAELFLATTAAQADAVARGAHARANVLWHRGERLRRIMAAEEAQRLAEVAAEEERCAREERDREMRAELGLDGFILWKAERQARQDDPRPDESTIADQIAAQFGNDGLNWHDAENRHLDEVCEALTSREWRDGYRTGDTYRYEFADGSAIVVAGDCWDVEGDEPFVLAGA